MTQTVETRKRNAYAVVVCLWFASATAAAHPPLEEATVSRLQADMAAGELSAYDLAVFYLERIKRLDVAGPKLRSIIEVNPDALDIARSLDEERAKSGPRGVLHGIPVVLKANIDTADGLSTTAGSVAMAGHRARRDAEVVKELRAAGAVILGKANLSEWANFRALGGSVSGWSSLGGQTRNAYDLARSPGGSSSGSAVAVAANLSALAVGTETDGSIINPSALNGIVGIKPTHGLVGNRGIVPVAHSQDTAGPMARTVADAAALLSAMVPTRSSEAARRILTAATDCATGRSLDSLVGRRIGVLRTYEGVGNYPRVERIFQQSIDALAAGGAVVVDPVLVDVAGLRDAEREVLLHEFRHDIEQYLEETQAPVRDLQALIEYNNHNAKTVMPYFGQETLELAFRKGPLSAPDYRAALEDSKRISRDAIDLALEQHDLDALVAPSNSPAWLIDTVLGDPSILSSAYLAAVSGYPSITVPAGSDRGLPIGVSFVGAGGTDAGLIYIACAFEAATKARRAPKFAEDHGTPAP